MAGLYGALGVPGGVIVVVILGYRLISFWIPVCLGFLLVPVLSLFAPRGTNLSWGFGKLDWIGPGG